MENEKKLVMAYVVKRYDNGDTDIENFEVEGTELPKLTNEEMYRDVEDVAKLIKHKRMEQAAYVGCYRFFQDQERARQQAMAQQAAAENEANLKIKLIRKK